jgi:hypothetical protein
MNCYICTQQPGVGGTHYHIQAAVGICHNCGVAVCATHSSKSEELGAPLLCPSCAQLQEEKKKVQPNQVLQPT